MPMGAAEEDDTQAIRDIYEGMGGFAKQAEGDRLRGLYGPDAKPPSSARESAETGEAQSEEVPGVEEEGDAGDETAEGDAGGEGLEAKADELAASMGPEELAELVRLLEAKMMPPGAEVA